MRRLVFALMLMGVVPVQAADMPNNGPGQGVPKTRTEVFWGCVGENPSTCADSINATLKRRSEDNFNERAYRSCDWLRGKSRRTYPNIMSDEFCRTYNGVRAADGFIDNAFKENRCGYGIVRMVCALP